ncbi:hypothetical protein [Stenotrophomonas sp. GD04024]|uniref:hypothetical protein n=1 Tax=Stenotrophomonas sp. GD04024 TaxID=2975422 RepID=UPI00244C7AD2|nr:hypothetical protein [Stenotrophomonas sp. GD04024]MDG9986823.1 hypothetical protein [Stenotrophomonas sp. GD04024]
MSSTESSNSSSTDPDQRAVSALWTVWERMAGMFPGKWVRENGAAPVNNAGSLTTAGELWFQVMSGITPRQVAEGLANCLRSALQWPPNPGQFRAMCLGVPALAEVDGQMRPGQAHSGFTVLVRSKLDLHAYRTAEGGAQQQRMLANAYERAVKHVMDGGTVPEPAAALTAPTMEPQVVRDRNAARSAMALAAAELGFGDAHGAG